MRVLVIADTDLDGTGAAAIITKYHRLFAKRSKMPPFRMQERDVVEVYFPDRVTLNREFENRKLIQSIHDKYDLIYLCDTGLNSPEGNKNLGEILAPKTIYFDHHATNLDRQQEYADRYKGFYIEEGARCTAKIAFDTLRHFLTVDGTVNQLKEFKKLQKFALLVNDLDLWYRKILRSTELADYEAIVGPEKGYAAWLEIAENPDSNTADMVEVLETVKKQKERSLALARATLVKHKGYKTPFHTCLVDDWASWVSGEICPKTGMLAMFDISRKSLSFRVGSKYIGTEWHDAKEPKPNCLHFAEVLGGGGHPQAAGVSTGEASPIFKELSRRLGELLLEVNDEGKKAKKTTRER
jgi:hypothetical protein